MFILYNTFDMPYRLKRGRSMIGRRQVVPLNYANLHVLNVIGHSGAQSSKLSLSLDVNRVGVEQGDMMRSPGRRSLALVDASVPILNVVTSFMSIVKLQIYLTAENASLLPGLMYIPSGAERKGGKNLILMLKSLNHGSRPILQQCLQYLDPNLDQVVEIWDPNLNLSCRMRQALS